MTFWISLTNRYLAYYIEQALKKIYMATTHFIGFGWGKL